MSYEGDQLSGVKKNKVKKNWNLIVYYKISHSVMIVILAQG